MTATGAFYDDVHIFLVDDICRFAVHLARYFDGPITVGTGRLPSRAHEQSLFFKLENPGESGERINLDEPLPLLTGDPRVTIWWLPAWGKQWRYAYERIVSRQTFPGRSKFYVLVDILGRHDEGEKSSYDHEEVYRFFSDDLERQKDIEAMIKGEDKKKPSVEIAIGEPWLITSYETSFTERYVGGMDTRDVRSKSPATFRELRTKVRQNLPQTQETRGTKKKSGKRTERSGDDSHVHHLLVTGAGFEMKCLEHLEFGVRWTNEIIEAMYHIEKPSEPEKKSPNDLTGRALAAIKPEGYKRAPFQLPEFAGNNFELLVAALENNLDRYWDLLIQREYDLEIAKIDDSPEKRNAAKVRAHKNSQELRNAFRQAMLRDDWGIMKQSLDAAGLPWKAWLTTNYTRFADRAIQIRHRHDQILNQNASNATQGQKGIRWRTISTATEASILMREILFGANTDQQNGDDASKSLIFKLHGDISHVHTMAISGQDKEIFSTTGLPLDNLSLIYQAAQRYLISLADPAGRSTAWKAPTLCWHIVGHGMQDQLLSETIYRISQHIQSQETIHGKGKRRQLHKGKCHFIFVGPNPSDSLACFEKNIEEMKGRDSFELDDGNTALEKGNAFEYLSRLRVHGWPRLPNSAK